jgi:PhnB protein
MPLLLLLCKARAGIEFRKFEIRTSSNPNPLYSLAVPSPNWPPTAEFSNERVSSAARGSWLVNTVSPTPTAAGRIGEPPISTSQCFRPSRRIHENRLRDSAQMAGCCFKPNETLSGANIPPSFLAAITWITQIGRIKPSLLHRRNPRNLRLYTFRRKCRLEHAPFDLLMEAGKNHYGGNMKEVVTYLNFDGNCREAMKFYERCLGAELSLVPFSETPGDFPKEAKDRIMHARLAKGSTILMASDTMPGMPFHQGNNFSIAVMCESPEEIDRFFAALSDKGKIIMPLQTTFWAARFGMLTDRFGINWMLNYEAPKQG